MSIFRNKILVKIIATLCIFLTLMNFGMPAKVYAGNWGGMLITPVVLLLTSIADGIMGILHKTIQYQDLSLIRIADEPEWWDKWGKSAIAWIVTAFIVLVTVAVVVFTAGTAATVIAGIGAVTKALITIGVVEIIALSTTGTGAATFAGQFVAQAITEGAFPETIYMPVFTVTPYNIFSNKLLLFDINFFKPMEDQVVTVSTPADVVIPEASYGTMHTSSWIGNQELPMGYKMENEKASSRVRTFFDLINSKLPEEHKINVEDQEKTFFKRGTKVTSARNHQGVTPEGGNWEITSPTQNNYKHASTGKGEKLGEDWPAEITTGNYPCGISLEELIIHIYTEEQSGGLKEYVIRYRILKNFYDSLSNKPDGFELKVDEEIFVCLNEYDNEYKLILDEVYEVYFNSTVSGAGAHTQTITVQSTAKVLKETVSKWYFLLRNLALLVLLLILIYTGIKIVVSSTAGQKAKYKERIMDWLVAMCLLFIMQYIMFFAMELTDKFIKLIQAVDSYEGTLTYVPLTENQIKYIEKNETGEEIKADRDEYIVFDGMGAIVQRDGKTYLGWTSEILGKIKILSQTSREGTANWVGSSLCYLVLVLSTAFFVWTYLKRVIYMAFLTVIAPLVAAMYPIDKMNDGKAQAFEAWLKEYIFNLLIQPVHLILYLVLVGSAYVLAATNPVYAVVAIGFLMPAEKLLRSFFGFNKAKTPSALGGAAGAALAFTGLQRVMSFGRKADKHGKDKKDNDNAKIKFANSQGVNAKDAVANSVLGKKTTPTVKTQNNKPSGAEPPISPNKLQQQTPNKAQTVSEAQSQVQAATQAQAQARVATRTTGNALKGAQNKNNQQSTNKRSIRRAAVGVGKRYGRLMGKRITDKIKNTSITKAAVRGLAGAYGAAAMGMAGLALGVASGDPSKAFQYTTAGVTGGYAAGKGLGGAAINAVSVDKNQIKDEMEMAEFGEDYKKVKLEEEGEAMASNEKNIDTIRKLTSLSHEEAKDVLQTVGKSCYGSGIDKMEDIAAVYQMEKNGHSREEAMAALKFNQYLPSDLNKMGEEERNDHIARWTREYEEAGYENSGTLAEESMKLAEEINKIKSGLKKA